MHEEIWQVERQLWLEGVEAYRAHMAESCIMVFGPMGILQRAAILESREQAPRWTAVEMTEQQTAEPAPDCRVIAYRAEARRDDARPYLAYCSSTYVRRDGDWRLVQHQQTPVEPA